MRPGTWALLVLASLASPLPGQVTLAWKFQEGQTFFLERVFQQKQMIEVKGKNFKQESTNTWLTKIAVKKVTPELISLDQTIVAVTSKHTGKPTPGQDQTSEAQLIEKMKGCTLQLKVTPAGRVQEFLGYEDMIQKVADKQEEREKALRFLVPESALRDGLEEALGFLPQKPVQPGDPWQRQAVEPVPPFGAFQTLFQYTYAGRKDNEDLITFTLQMKYVPPAKDLTLFRVIKGELQGDQGKGQIFFAGQQGRLLRGEKQVQVRGNLTLEAAGNQTNLEFSSENRLTWRLLDQLPK
jgi:hypothetical protein